MAEPQRLECIRCAQQYPLEGTDQICENCGRSGVASNLTPRYSDCRIPEPNEFITSDASLWRYAAQLPLDAKDAVTLGEGMTPLVSIEGFGHGHIRVKDETQNPTWSFKDRLATVAVSWARKNAFSAIGTSSTGNAGAAAAAYAAKAAMPCVVFTYTGAAMAMVSQMRSYGAMVLTLPNPEDRWAILSQGVQTYGWFPTSPFFGPTVGSNPIGIEGYKTLAYEIAEQSDWNVPDWCVLPVCYGDALYGLWKGFDEMNRWGWTDKVPRLVAAEVSGSLTAALAQNLEMPPIVSRNKKSVANSIDVMQGTFQARYALKMSDGLALTLTDACMLTARDRLASGSGMFAEISSAAPFAAIDLLSKEGTILPEDNVVAILTASGLKDFGVPGRKLKEAPHVEPNIGAVLETLAEYYGFHV